MSCFNNTNDSFSPAVMSADIPRLYKELQLTSALIAEKEKHLGARRQALQELRIQLKAGMDTCAERQSLVAIEAAKLNEAKKDLQEKQQRKASKLHEQQNRIITLEQEEGRLQRQATKAKNDISTMLDRVQRARSSTAAVEEISQQIPALQQKYAKREAEINEFESKVKAAETESQQRYLEYEKLCPQHPLPRVTNAPALEEPCESVMLVEETF